MCGEWHQRRGTMGSTVTLYVKPTWFVHLVHHVSLMRGCTFTQQQKKAHTTNTESVLCMKLKCIATCLQLWSYRYQSLTAPSIPMSF